MSTARVTRSSVLGKRGHQQEEVPAGKDVHQLQSPEATPNPKRARTATVTIFDGQGNKENIPPYRIEAINVDASPTTARQTRALRRAVTEAVVPTVERPGPRRRASASTVTPSTPTNEIVRLAISTPPPTPPTLLVPLHARVKALLRATCNNADATVAGREIERDTISKFLHSFVSVSAMQEDGPTTLFISGSPGTGKTALVNSINSDLSKENNMTVVFVNCMTVKTLDALWDRIIEELRSIYGAPGRSKKEKGMTGVVNLLTSRSNKLVLVLDELDHVAADPQSLSSLFSLSEKTSSTLRVIGIANTHTLTANSAYSSVDPAHVQTLHFAPYTPLQLQTILQSRLASLYVESELSSAGANNIKKLLPTPSIVLLTKRIANITGDVRSLFEVLRGAIDLAVAATNQASSDPLNSGVPSTTPQNILAALKAYTPATNSKPAGTASTSATPAASSNSEVVNKIRNLGFQPRVVLLSLLLATKRFEAGLKITSNVLASPKKSNGSPMKRTISAPSPSSTAAGVDTQQLYAFYTTILERSDLGVFDPVSRNDFGDLLNMLEGVGLIQLSSSLLSTTAPKGKRAFSRQASFGAGLGRNGAGTVGEVQLVDGVWAEEILRGLGITDSTANDGDVRNEEIKGVWVAETNKIMRDVKTLVTALANSNKDRTLGFADASED